MAVKNDLVIDQGTTFTTTINLVDEANNPLALDGYSAISQMKKWYSSVTSIQFTTAINAVSGSVILSLPSSITSNVSSGRYVYDVELIDPANNVSRVVEGIAIVTPGVTNLSIDTTANTYNPNTDFSAIPMDG